MSVKPRMVLWSVGITLASSERDDIIAMALAEGRSISNMIRTLTREARVKRLGSYDGAGPAVSQISSSP